MSVPHLFQHIQYLYRLSIQRRMFTRVFCTKPSKQGSTTSVFYSFPDIDECKMPKPCDVTADCRNTVGSFICSCNSGYTGDGFNCTGECVYI